MSYKVSKLDVPGKDDRVVIYCAGEVDESTLADFQKEIRPILELPGLRLFIFHFRDFEYFNSKVIGFLAGIYSELREKNQKMVLAECNEHILDVLTLVGFTNLVEHYDSLKDAIEASA